MPIMYRIHISKDVLSI